MRPLPEHQDRLNEMAEDIAAEYGEMSLEEASARLSHSRPIPRDTLDGASVVGDGAAGGGGPDRTATPDFKPPKRIVATRSEWEIIRLFKLEGKRCRVCVVGFAATLHHLVPKSLGGDDLAPNLIPVCGDGTRGCHGLVEARSLVALEKVRLTLQVEEIEYVYAKKGVTFIDRYYPSPRRRPAPCS